MNATIVNPSDLARHDNWSPSYHRMLSVANADMHGKLAAFWEWMRYLGLGPKAVQNVLHRAASADEAVTEVMKLILRRGPGSETSKRVALTLEELEAVEKMVRELAGNYADREQKEVETRSSNLGAFKKKFEAPTNFNNVRNGLTKTAESVVGNLLR